MATSNLKITLTFELSKWQQRAIAAIVDYDGDPGSPRLCRANLIQAVERALEDAEDYYDDEQQEAPHSKGGRHMEPPS
ncbi:MAG TPA: hypothetical protein VKU02_04725 [Gemmataceae bacterium]|nr:hypothetical protein [Gemmataceae bacterium]